MGNLFARGLGKALLDAATDWLFQRGHERIRLTTGADTRADRFYLARGWRREPVSASEIAYTLARALCAKKKSCQGFFDEHFVQLPLADWVEKTGGGLLVAGCGGGKGAGDTEQEGVGGVSGDPSTGCRVLLRTCTPPR